MKKIYFWAGILGVMPGVANAQTCIDFDDNGQFIEYDCSVPMTKKDLEMASVQANLKQCGLEKCRIFLPFVGIGATKDIANDLGGFTGEIGVKFRPLSSRWYSTFSVIAERIRVDDYMHYNDGGSFGHSEKTSFNLALGAGYRLTQSFDVYTKLTAGMYKAKVDGCQFVLEIVTENPFNIEYINIPTEPVTQTSLDFGVIIGVNYNIYKCFNVFAEAQILPLGFYGTVENDENAIARDVNKLARIGVRVAF